jgi:hypothetical protein
MTRGRPAGRPGSFRSERAFQPLHGKLDQVRRGQTIRLGRSYRASLAFPGCQVLTNDGFEIHPGISTSDTRTRIELLTFDPRTPPVLQDRDFVADDGFARYIGEMFSVMQMRVSDLPIFVK